MQTLLKVNKDFFRPLPYDTFGVSVTSGDTKYLKAVIYQTHGCCGHIVPVERRIFQTENDLYEYAIERPRALNAASANEFLERKPKILKSIFALANDKGIILTRALHSSALFDDTHPLHKWCPRLARMGPKRFLAICDILTKYGLLYTIGDHTYVSTFRGA
jgi:hypothetical protein